MSDKLEELTQQLHQSNQIAPGCYDIPHTYKDCLIGYALVIGMSQYKDLDKLSGVPYDVLAISEFLSRHGYDVRLVYEIDKKELEEEMKDFAEYAPKKHPLFIYLAGHGGIRGNDYFFGTLKGNDNDVAVSGILESDYKDRMIFLCIDTCTDDIRPIRKSIVHDPQKFPAFCDQLTKNVSQKILLRIATDRESQDGRKEPGALVKNLQQAFRTQLRFIRAVPPHMVGFPAKGWSNIKGYWLSPGIGDEDIIFSMPVLEALHEFDWGTRISHDQITKIAECIQSLIEACPDAPHRATLRRWQWFCETVKINNINTVCVIARLLCDFDALYRSEKWEDFFNSKANKKSSWDQLLSKRWFNEYDDVWQHPIVKQIDLLRNFKALRKTLDLIDLMIKSEPISDKEKTMLLENLRSLDLSCQRIVAPDFGDSERLEDYIDDLESLKMYSEQIIKILQTSCSLPQEMYKFLLEIPFLKGYYGWINTRQEMDLQYRRLQERQEEKKQEYETKITDLQEQHATELAQLEQKRDALTQQIIKLITIALAIFSTKDEQIYGLMQYASLLLQHLSELQQTVEEQKKRIDQLQQERDALTQQIKEFKTMARIHEILLGLSCAMLLIFIVATFAYLYICLNYNICLY